MATQRPESVLEAIMHEFKSPLFGHYIAHWRSLCPPGGIPTTEDYLDHMDPKAAPLLMIFDVLAHDITVRFQGHDIGERRHKEQAGTSWFATNPHLNAANVVANMWQAVRHPCGVWTEAIFVTNVQRRLRVEALSLPLIAKKDRPARLVNLSVGLDSMDFDERAMGWHGLIMIGWYDLGFGVPSSAPLPVN